MTSAKDPSFLTVKGTADGSAREADDTPKAISWKFMVFHCPTCRSPVRERFGATCADDWHDHVTGWVAPDQPAIMIMGNGPHLPPPCTCHPDDNPPRPCPRKYAYSECVKAAAADTARDAERTGQQTRPKSSWELRAEAAEAEIARLSLQLHEAQQENVRLRASAPSDVGVRQDLREVPDKKGSEWPPFTTEREQQIEGWDKK